jgi:hypothetical protein
MGRYEEFRDDDNADKVDVEYAALEGNAPVRRFNAGLSVGILAALALVLLVAYGSGWVNPLPVTPTISELPVAPPPVETPQAEPPKT